VATELEVEKAVSWASRIPDEKRFPAQFFHGQAHEQRIKHEDHDGQTENDDEAIAEEKAEQLLEHFGFGSSGFDDLASHEVRRRKKAWPASRPRPFG